MCIRERQERQRVHPARSGENARCGYPELGTPRRAAFGTAVGPEASGWTLVLVAKQPPSGDTRCRSRPFGTSHRWVIPPRHGAAAWKTKRSGTGCPIHCGARFARAREAHISTDGPYAPIRSLPRHHAGDSGAARDPRRRRCGDDHRVRRRRPLGHRHQQRLLGPACRGHHASRAVHPTWHPAWSTMCVTGVLGSCTSSNLSSGRYLVREAPSGAPAGWRDFQNLSWGGAAAAQSPSRPYVGDISISGNSGNNFNVGPATTSRPTTTTTRRGRS